jgi:small subunit ribosomal protein S5
MKSNNGRVQSSNPKAAGKATPKGSRREKNQVVETPDFTAGLEPSSELSEKVIFINRSAKVVKGGRRFSFSALVVAGDRKGKVGLGMGKAGEVANAIKKATETARKNMETIAIKDATIPHEVLYKYSGAKILLKPASPGTGIIAGKTVRAVIEAAGIKDILTKSLGSNSPVNLAKATFEAIKSLRLKEDIIKIRGLDQKQKETSEPDKVTQSTNQ